MDYTAKPTEEFDTASRRNPSRKECEKTIRRILITEILENGRNMHFRMATDFLKYFESLYPASDSLTKQIQRAVKAMDMPKDENGFYIVDKTVKQVELENSLKTLFQESGASLVDLSEYIPIAISLDAYASEYAAHLIEKISAISDLVAHAVPSTDGIILYTKNKERLMFQLTRLLGEDAQSEV